MADAVPQEFRDPTLFLTGDVQHQRFEHLSTIGGPVGEQFEAVQEGRTRANTTSPGLDGRIDIPGSDARRHRAYSMSDVLLRAAKNGLGKKIEPRQVCFAGGYDPRRGSRSPLQMMVDAENAGSGWDAYISTSPQEEPQLVEEPVFEDPHEEVLDRITREIEWAETFPLRNEPSDKAKIFMQALEGSVTRRIKRFSKVITDLGDARIESTVFLIEQLKVNEGWNAIRSEICGGILMVILGKKDGEIRNALVSMPCFQKLYSILTYDVNAIEGLLPQTMEVIEE